MSPSRGEPIGVEVGDFLVMPFPDCDEVYRVKGNAFHDIYGLDRSNKTRGENDRRRVPSQSDVVRMWSEKLKQENHIYHKTKVAHAKVAEEPGVLLTVVNGSAEARRTYNQGDFIICGSRGGKYPVSFSVLMSLLFEVRDAPIADRADDWGAILAPVSSRISSGCCRPNACF